MNSGCGPLIPAGSGSRIRARFLRSPDLSVVSPNFQECAALCGVDSIKFQVAAVNLFILRTLPDLWIAPWSLWEASSHSWASTLPNIQEEIRANLSRRYSFLHIGGDPVPLRLLKQSLCRENTNSSNCLVPKWAVTTVCLCMTVLQSLDSLKAMYFIDDTPKGSCSWFQ